MGNIFGMTLNNGINLKFNPDVTPHPLKESQFDPQLGFEGSRKERSITTTRAEMESAKVHPMHRDYCVDFLMKFRACRKENFPWVVKCEHEKHEFLHCQYEDFVLRMKEYERERRLLVREKNRQAGSS